MLRFYNDAFEGFPGMGRVMKFIVTFLRFFSTLKGLVRFLIKVLREKYTKFASQSVALSSA